MRNRILYNLTLAEVATMKLQEMGIDVACIDVTEMRPKIWLRGRDEDLRAKLGGGLHMIRPAASGREVVMATSFENCQLHWGCEL
ncbi:MAG: hypothetical protein HY272_01845 [Gammaproteobacteria bacterium]|nr:hypothetical protein [Gammaproteobacteria bacterium]